MLPFLNDGGLLGGLGGGLPPPVGGTGLLGTTSLSFSKKKKKTYNHIEDQFTSLFI